MQLVVRAAVVASLGLSLHASVRAVHEDDPKILDKVPAYMGRAARTNVVAGQPMASGGLPVPFTSSNVRLLSWMPLTEFGVPPEGNANVVWNYTSPSGTCYALLGLSTGTAFVRLADPANPQLVTVMSGPSSLWRDIRVFGQYAYAVSEGGSGIQIFNLSQIDSGTVTLANTITTGGAASTHTVWIDTASGFLYRCGGAQNTGLRIYNLNSSATNPPLVAQWNTYYVHEVLVKTYTSGPYAGKQIAFACSGLNNGSTNTALRVLDVTNKSNIVQLDDAFWPNAAYSHQCYLSPDAQTLYLNDELDEETFGTRTLTEVFNVSNLSNVTRLGNFTNNNTAIGHNLYTVGNYIYEANYRSGLRVFDASAGPLAAVEVGNYDTWEGDDFAAFNGLWMANPFSSNGVVLGSDIEKGLFVWWFGAPLLDVELAQVAPIVINPAGMSVGATITESAQNALVAGSERLNYDAGSGVVSLALTNLGNGNYDAHFPALPCGTTVTWYVSAQSTNGITWTYPAGGASSPISSTVALAVTTVAQADMETAAGWTSGDTGDNAATGVWTRANPVGTEYQPEDDHSASGSTCWVTGNATAGASVGTNDVDSGTTTLKSAVYNLASVSDPIVGYWRWFANNQLQSPGDDVFVIDINNGTGWVNVETLGPIGAEFHGGWYYHEFHVNQFVTPTATVQLRFKASDLGTQGIVEAAIDDFTIRTVNCSTPSTYCTAGTSANGCVATLSSSGTPSASAGAGFTITASNVEGQKSGLVFYGVSGALANSWGAGSSSFLCVKAPTQRTPAQASGGTNGACDGSVSLDWNAFIANYPGALGAPFSAGQNVWAQAWYRDPPSPNTTSLSNGITFTAGP